MSGIIEMRKLKRRKAAAVPTKGAPQVVQATTKESESDEDAPYEVSGTIRFCRLLIMLLRHALTRGCMQTVDSVTAYNTLLSGLMSHKESQNGVKHLKRPRHNSAPPAGVLLYLSQLLNVTYAAHVSRDNSFGN